MKAARFIIEDIEAALDINPNVTMVEIPNDFNWTDIPAFVFIGGDENTGVRWDILQDTGRNGKRFLKYELSMVDYKRRKP